MKSPREKVPVRIEVICGFNLFDFHFRPIYGFVVRIFIAQLVIMPYLPVQWNEVAELNETERADNGFGSTGVSGETEYEQFSLFDGVL